LKNIEIYKAPSKLKAITYKETVVSGKVAAYAEVTIKSGSRTLKTGKANSVGHFVITLPKQRNNTSLTVTTTDGSSTLIKVTR
jgi:cell wall-associated protease